MFKIKCYKYDSSQEANGYRGIGDNDFSDFVMQGEDLTEDITQVMDTGEITLVGLPFKKAFDPETKFIIDIVEYESVEYEEIVSTFHLVVSKDVVNQPILSDNNYYDHHISFIEPSVIAQKRLVDNIAATYKLKKVNLQAVPAFPDTKIQIPIQNPTIQNPNFTNFGKINIVDKGAPYHFKSWEQHIGKYFQTGGAAYGILNSDGERFNDQYLNIDNFGDGEERFARFQLPVIYVNRGMEFFDIYGASARVSIDYLIEEFDTTDDVNPTNSWSGSVITNDNLYNTTPPYTPAYVPYADQYGDLLKEWIPEAMGESSTGVTNDIQFRKYTDITAPNPSYITQEFPIKVNKRYKLTISLHEFPDDIPDNQYAKKYTNSSPTFDVYMAGETRLAGDYFQTTSSRNKVTYLTPAQIGGSTYVTTYDAESSTIVYKSAQPYSALALLQKAIINSGLYEKKQDVYIADVNSSSIPFYIDPNYTKELLSTTVIENFYNQKNLWEIMVEVGNYIHAIPELKFGSDDRFVITFNKLGKTTTKDGIDAISNENYTGTHLSVFNSRSVEDYISSTSSYITNMVQLGGYIEEWVFPKTTNEQLLISNDTAQILTSKPIIELLSIKVRRNSDGTIADLTDYIYEENVYKTLSIDYKVVPNRGIALYYKLGTNVITGGDYQLPQENTNIYSDYAFKKVIYSAFNKYPVYSPPPTSGYWTELKINDYSFFVRYRTKDNVRQNHIRPDLRKYLLNSKWDRYPEHNQFNNQTDVVVDSIKFGNNMFGKLIRTGNNSYEIYEWNDSWDNVKHKGELYKIDDELYYVAKVAHTIYNSFIVSKISYSKDYNELSNIIGIPSEPRFYEISEQSLIWRDFEINDILLLTDNEEELEYKSNYVFNYNHLANLIIGVGTDFAKYAVTVFKGDKDPDPYDQTVGISDLYIEVISPINAYSSENTLTYEYDMEDNYSAGDKVITTEQEKAEEGSYNSLWAVKYTDIYGKSALIDFYILGNIGTIDPTSPSGYTPPTISETMAFPESPISTKKDDERPFIGNYDILATNVMEYDTNFNGRGIGLLKDCREAISVNYNLRMATSSDTFVFSPYVYLPRKSNVRLVLLSSEVNKLSTGYIDDAEIITPLDKQGNLIDRYFQFTPIKTQAPNSFDETKNIVSKFGINLSEVFANVADEHFTGENGYQRIKSIAILCDVSLDADLGTENPIIPNRTQFIVARNIPEQFTRSEALASWWWGAPKKDSVFKNKQ